MGKIAEACSAASRSTRSTAAITGHGRPISLGRTADGCNPAKCPQRWLVCSHEANPGELLKRTSRLVSCFVSALLAACTGTAETAADTATPTTGVTTSTMAPAESTTSVVEVHQDPDEAVATARQLLEAVMAKNQTAIVELVEVPDSMAHTTDQLRNAFRFAIATSWLDGIGDCTFEQSTASTSGVVVVNCLVSSRHPLFGFPAEEMWDLHVQNGAVIDAGEAPYSTQGDADFLEWMKAERSTVTDSMCGADAYETSEVFADTTVYPLHPRCGRYLEEQMGHYFVAAHPDHPLATWQRFTDAWNDRQVEEVMSLFAEEAVLDTGPSLFGTYTGREEIRNWVEFEFDNYVDSVTYFEDFEVDGSALRMISSWTDRSGNRLGFRPDVAVIESGQIQSLVFGELPTG